MERTPAARGQPALAILLTLALAAAARAEDAPLAVAVTANAKAIPPFEVLELTFRCEREIENPYLDVAVQEPENAAAMEKGKRFIEYSVDRWGAYVDVWELHNEQKAADGWYAITAPPLRSVDPYRHPIATSWERPELAGIEVNAPHDYYGSSPDPDTATASRADRWKKAGKPVIVGETGNWVNADPEKRPPGHGGVSYPQSAERMRVRNWVALFEEVTFVYWNTSYARDGHFMNLWIGPREGST